MYERKGGRGHYNMRTSLKYDVMRQSKYDYKSGREIEQIKSRSFLFNASGADNPSAQKTVIDSFAKFLADNNIRCDIFGDGTWEENVKFGDTRPFLFIYIPINDASEKDEITKLYKEWKETEHKKKG